MGFVMYFPSGISNPSFWKYSTCEESGSLVLVLFKFKDYQLKILACRKFASPNPNNTVSHF